MPEQEYTPDVTYAKPIPPDRGDTREQQPVYGLPGTHKEIEITDDTPLAVIKKSYLADTVGLSKKIVNIDPDRLSQKLNIIDGWIRNEVTEREWNQTVKSYLDVFTELKEKLNISDNITPLSQIDKIFSVLEKAWDDKKLQKKLGIKFKSII